MKTRAILYARVSTDEQAGNYSLPSQLEMGRDYCKRKGYTVIKEVKEDYTGTRVDRPALSLILEKPALFDVLVVMSIDRFARSLAVQVLLEKEFKELGKRVEYVIGGGDDSPEGNMMNQMQAIVAEYEVQNFLRRTTRGKMARARAGKLLPGAMSMYGYDYVDGKYVVNKQEAKVVRQIHGWYLDDELGLRGIAYKLTEMGIPTRHDTIGRERKKGSRWGKSSVFKILTNPAYMGTWTYHGTNPVAIEIPALVSKEEFEAIALQMRKNRVHAKRNTKHLYLFRQRLICGKCGYKFQASSHRDLRYYRCLGQRKENALTNRPCQRSLVAAKVDELLWSHIYQMLKNPERVVEALQEQERIRAGNDQGLDVAQVLQSRVEELEQKRERLIILYEDGNMPRDVLDKRMTENTNDLDKAREQLAELEPKTIRSRYTAPELIERMTELLPGATFADRAGFLSDLNVRVTAYRGESAGDDKYRITLDFGDSHLVQLVP